MMPTEAEPVTVVEGDALDVLRSLSDGFCDHVITDPPYSEKTHAGARTRVITGRAAAEEYRGSVPVVDFDSISEGDFITLCCEFVRVARRWVVATCDWRHLVTAEREIPEFVRFGVWVKPDGAPQFSGDRPGTGWEAVIVLHRKGRKRWNGGGLPGVWMVNTVRGNIHPTQKPLALVRKWVRQFTDSEELILDPFAGSGTTGHAAIAEGRRAILVERDPEYVAVIRDRINTAMGRGKGSLFTEVL